MNRILQGFTVKLRDGMFIYYPSLPYIAHEFHPRES